MKLIKKFLSELNTNKYDLDSIFNQYGTYGSKYSSNSIWNEYGSYGSKYSAYSAFNKYSNKPPLIIDGSGKIIGRVTVNTYIQGGIDPNKLYDLLLQLGL